MKTRFQLPAVGLMILGAAFGAPPPVVPADAAPKESVVKKTTRLIEEDVAFTPANAPVHQAADANPAKPAPLLLQNPAEPLVFATMVVREREVPEIPPAVHESRAAEVLRTGTFWRRIGPRFTTQLWARGDKGLMLTLAW